VPEGGGAVRPDASTVLGSSRLASIIAGARGSIRRKFGRAGFSGLPLVAVIAWRRWSVIVCLGALGKTGCGGSGGGGSGSASLKLALLTHPWVGSVGELGSVSAEAEHRECDQAGR
jgi:hypothetical protein